MNSSKQKPNEANGREIPRLTAGKHSFTRRRKWLFRLLAITLAGGVALLVGEIAVRIIYGSPLAESRFGLRVQSHPTRGWEMVPGEGHYNYQYPVEVNSLGFRGPEVPPRELNEYRVLVLGDSTTYGQGVADGDTLPAQMEKALRASGDDRNYRVINAGLRAYSTNQELALLEEYIDRLKPDAVVLVWYPNDIEEYDLAEIAKHYAATGPRHFDGEYRGGWGKLRWTARSLVRKSALCMLVHDVYANWHAESPGDEAIAAGMRRWQGHLPKFIDLCEKRQTKFLVCFLPSPAAVEGNAVDRSIERQADEIAAAQHVERLDLTAAVEAARAAEGRLPIVPFDGHYDAAANHALGAAAAQKLREIDAAPAATTSLAPNTTKP